MQQKQGFASGCNKDPSVILKKPCSPEINDHVHPNPLGGPQHSPHVKCPLPQYIFFTKTNPCTCWKHVVAIFFHNFSNKSCLFTGFKTCEKPRIFCSQPSQKGSGSTPDLMSHSTLHVCSQRVNAM